MLGLLRFPNFAEPLVAGFALADLAHLSVKVFEALSLRVGRNFDGALFWDERDLIVSVFIRRAVEHGTNLLADGHLVCPPVGIEQNAVAVFCGAIRERDEQHFAVVAKYLFDLAFHGNAAFEFELRLLAFGDLSFFPFADRRPESFLMIIDSVSGQLFLLERERSLAGSPQINGLSLFVRHHFGEYTADLQPR